MSWKKVFWVGIGSALLAGCYNAASSGVSISQDTTHFNGSYLGVVGLTIANNNSQSITLTVPATGTNQYSVVANPATSIFYNSQLSGSTYCTLISAPTGGYTTTLQPDSSCDMLLLAAQNNTPGNSQFMLELSLKNDAGFFLFPVTVFLNNYLYAAGEFTQNAPGGASTLTYNHLAKWDGNSWTAVTTNGVSDDVNVIATDPLTGDLYAGGWFEHAGDMAAGHIVKVNRNGAGALGAGLDNAVNAITFNTSTGAVLAGGNFAESGAIAMHYLASYDGSSWANLDPANVLSGPVRAIGFDSSTGKVYVGGNFPIADGSNTFGNQVAYPIYQDSGSGLSVLIYANERVDTLLPTNTYGLLIGGDFNQYAATLGSSATTASYLGMFLNDDLIQIGAPANQPNNAGDINRTVKSMVLLGNTLYVTGYFQSEVTSETYAINPYGNTQIVVACNLTTKTCTNIGSPTANPNIYWVYQLVGDNNGNLYGITQDGYYETIDGGAGWHYPYYYSPATGQWTQLGTTGFNYIAFAETLGSTLTVSVPQG